MILTTDKARISLNMTTIFSLVSIPNEKNKSLTFLVIHFVKLYIFSHLQKTIIIPINLNSNNFVIIVFTKYVGITI